MVFLRGVAEWSKAADLKSAVVQATGGSNPSSSAIKITGAVAQLGEHRLCKPRVSGSNPLSSTFLNFYLTNNKTLDII